MEVARLLVDGTFASVVMRRTITAGLVGATVLVEYAPGIWDGLTKTVVFKGSETKDNITNETTVEIPWEVLQEPSRRLHVGFFGVDADGKQIIPTIWADLGPIYPGADPSGDTSTDPGLPVWGQIADKVEKLSEEVDDLKEGGGPSAPGKPGADGEDGGYYTPAVTQLDEDTIQFAFTGSKEGMPAVDPVTVELPVGQGSGGNINWLDPEEGEVFTVIVPEPTLTGISASYTGGDVVIGTALTALVGIVVTATYSNGTTKTVTDYTLSGEIADGSNTITVTYEGMTATFTVTGVEEAPEVTLTHISATYTGGNVAVGTAVTDLTGITVTAHYSDGSTEPVTGYTLSGTIAEGSNTITVSYGGKTTTFVVTGEAEWSVPEVVAPASIETVDGVDYLTVTDLSLLFHTPENQFKANSYKNNNYQVYTTTVLGGIWDKTERLYGLNVPYDELATTNVKLLDSSVDGTVFGYGLNSVRLPLDLGGYETAVDYVQATYGQMQFKLLSGYKTKTIDPQKITSMTVKTSNYGYQYAQFGYSDLPSSNIYSPVTNLFVNGGDNVNMSNFNMPGACMGTTVLSISFPAGTFADFTLENVKAYLTKNPLILWHM